MAWKWTNFSPRFIFYSNCPILCFACQIIDFTIIMSHILRPTATETSLNLNYIGSFRSNLILNLSLAYSAPSWRLDRRIRNYFRTDFRQNYCCGPFYWCFFKLRSPWPVWRTATIWMYCLYYFLNCCCYQSNHSETGGSAGVCSIGRCRPLYPWVT